MNEPELIRTPTTCRCFFKGRRRITRVVLGATVVKLRRLECPDCGRTNTRPFVRENQRSAEVALARFRFVPIGYEKRGRD